MNLRQIRIEKGLSQIEVANYLDIGQTTYSGYETGYRRPTPEMLCKLANLYNVTVDELLGRTSEPELFDNARVERPEILELYESLTPELQAHALAYLHGLADRSAVQSSATVKIELDNRARKKQ